ncbi:hypothetical protein CBL_02205 [Carabus blaptoides fortunei]
MTPRKLPLASAAEEYFSNINPIASRIYADFQDTRNAYECVWDTLSDDEQSQILNECIIKPEVTLQYNLKSTAYSEKCTSDSYARKHVVDDHVSYRDEHSAPFSFRTMSQLDLRLFGGESCKKVLVTPKLEPVKLQPKVETPIAEAPAARYKTESSLFGKLLGRKQSPDAEQEVLVSPESNGDTSPNANLPKTGLDFLDNW